MNHYFFMIFAILVGVLTSLQAPINATMARILENPLIAAVISLFISFILTFTLWIIYANHEKNLVQQVTALPWWIIIGGVAGAIFVTYSIIIAPILGIAAYFVCIIAGQLIGSILIDQFGWFGMETKVIDMQKIIGITLILIGVILVQSK